MFELHPQLAADTVTVGELSLSRLLLSRDANYPWCILVPRRSDIREIYQLDKADRAQLLEESCWLSQTLEDLFQPTKINVAALGNMVPQLHLHHVARFDGDPAWPAPIWGQVPAREYQPDQLAQRMTLLQQAL